MHVFMYLVPTVTPHYIIMVKGLLHSFSYCAWYKCSWQLKPRYFARGSEGLSSSKGLLFEGKNHGPKDRAELQEYIGEPLARNTVDAFSDGRKY